METSSRMSGIKMSGIRKMFEMAGDNAVHLGLGEPDFQPPEHVMDALNKAVREGHNKYSSTFGLTPLREALARSYAAYGMDLGMDNIMVTASATEALYATFNTYIGPGDEVLTPNPGFVLYDPQIRLAGGVPVNYRLSADEGFLPTVEGLKALITPRTKALVINSPSNPTGSVMSRDLMKVIADLAREHSLLLISDEVYDRIIYDGEHVTAMEYYDDCVVINSFSKTIALTGWRLGYLASPSREIVEKISISHYYVIACPSTPLQYGALAALEQPEATDRYLRDMVSAFRGRRELIAGRISEIEGLEIVMPAGAFYMFPSFDVDMKAGDLAMELARNGLICSPGTAFGQFGEGHLRFSFAASDETIGKGMDIVERTLREISGR